MKIYPAGKDSKRFLLGLREAKSNYGYLGQDDPILHFGLGPHEFVDIAIAFVDGSEAAASDVRANQTIIVEGVSIAYKKVE